MRIIDTAGLTVACKEAAQAGFDFLLEPDLVPRLDPAGRHCLVPITLAADDRASRCKALLKLRGQTPPHVVVLDLPLRRYLGAERSDPPAPPPDQPPPESPCSE